MGVCASSHKHSAGSESNKRKTKGPPPSASSSNAKKRTKSPRTPPSPEKPVHDLTPTKQRPEHPDESETSATDVLDQTLPLTPVSVFSVSPDNDDTGNVQQNGYHSPTAPVKRMNVSRIDASDGADHPSLSSSGMDIQRFHSSVSKNTRQGRALQARLQKARALQARMSDPNMAQTALEAQNLVSESSDSEDGFDRSPSRAFSPLPIQYSMESHPPTQQQKQQQQVVAAEGLTNDEFEASLNESMVWCEVACQSAVLSVALSRQQPNLEQPAPPLFLAVGTEAGVLTVTELLEESPLTKAKARLGATLEMKRQGRIRSLDFCPSGLCFACGGDDGKCALIVLEPSAFDPKEYVLRVIAEIPRVDRIYAVQFSPDGNFLAVGGYDETVAIVDVTTITKPHVVAEIPVDGLISTLDWSADGEILAIGGSDKIVTLVDATQNWQILHDIRRPAAITSIAFHPSNQYVAIGSTDVVVIDRTSLQVVKEIYVSGPDGTNQNSTRGVRINDLCWSPGNGSYLVICANGHRAKLLETKTFSEIQHLKREADVATVVWGQQTAITGIPQKYLAMGGDDKKVLILKAGLDVHSSTTSSIGDDTSAASSSYFSNRGEWVLNDHAFQDVDDNPSPSETNSPTPKSEVQQEWVQTSDSPTEQRSMIHTVAFSRGSKSRPSAFFATASLDGMVTIRSTIGFKILCQLEFLEPITCISFSNGSRLMACGSADGKVRVVATAPVWTVATVIDAEAPVQSLAFSKNNERLSILGTDGILSLVDPQDNFALCGELAQEFITIVDWTSRYMAVGQDDGIITVYDAAEILKGSTRVEATIPHSSPVRALSIGGSNRFMAAGGDDGVLNVYSCSNDWSLVHHITLGFSIAALRWSPSGRHVSVTGLDKQLKVIDTVFWQEIDLAKDTHTEISSVSFSQDGKLLAYASETYGTKIINTISWDIVLDIAAPGSDTASNWSSPDEEDD